MIIHMSSPFDKSDEKEEGEFSLHQDFI